ncbi:MAG: winged helix-turn-helix transcriptional regulator [Burkholderiales bacterium]|nr:winged helix-turn-helix transcriptional regulator [Burkholderiales bacterium]
MSKKPNKPSFDDTRRLGIGRLLLMARRDFVARLQARLLAAGEPWHPSMMISSYVDSDGTRSGEIAKRMGITKQAVGRMVRDLESLGLLTQEPDPLDGRATRVRFTSAGLRYMVRMHRQIDEIEREYEALIGAERFTATREGLQIVAYGKRDDLPRSGPNRGRRGAAR